MTENYSIRYADINDLEQIAELERLCFPAEEAASKESFLERLSVYPNHFWILESEGRIVSVINGMVTDEADLKDEMYHDTGAILKK